MKPKKDLLIEDPLSLENMNMDISSLYKKVTGSISGILAGSKNAIKEKLSGLPNMTIDKAKENMEHSYVWFKDLYNDTYHYLEPHIEANKYMLGSITLIAVCATVLRYLSKNKSKLNKIKDINSIAAREMKSVNMEINKVLLKIKEYVKKSFARVLKADIDEIVGVTVIGSAMWLIYVVFKHARELQHSNLPVVDDMINNSDIILRTVGRIVVVASLTFKFVADVVLVGIPAVLAVGKALFFKVVNWMF